jgi:hypothetical protein
MYIRKNKIVRFDGLEKKEISRDRVEYLGDRGQVVYILGNDLFCLDVNQNFYLINHIKISYFEYHQLVDVKQLLDNFLEKYVQINC